MSLIPLIGISKGKIDIILVLCSEERYKEYLMTNEQYEYSVSATFFKKYLEEKGHTVELTDKLKPVVVTGSKISIYLWEHARVIDLRDVKDIIEQLDNDYTDFIDDYAKHLKTL